MCGCSSFDGNRPSEIVENDDLLNFGGENDEFDYFFKRKRKQNAQRSQGYTAKGGAMTYQPKMTAKDGEMTYQPKMVDKDDLLSFDGESDEFDNFLTKKSRERRRVQKELIAGGLGKKDAKTQALAQVPKDKLRDIIAKLQAGKSVISVDTPNGAVNLSTDPKKALDEVSNALTDAGGKTANDTTPDATAEKTFLQKNGLYIGIAVVVLVGGFFAWKKFGK
jgi:hypothetical protein